MNARYNLPEAIVPLYPDALDRIRDNLEKLSRGEKAPMIAIGSFSLVQFDDINTARRDSGLHELEQNEVVFIGRHLFNSRSADGYSIDDIIDQIESAMDEGSIAVVSPRMSCLRQQAARTDRYGNQVFDQAIFEMTNRKPRAELFSVIPRGDANKPPKKQKPTG
jgi:hypothetical protein